MKFQCGPDYRARMCESTYFAVDGPRSAVHYEEGFASGCHHVLTKQTCKTPIIKGRTNEAIIYKG